MAPILAGQYGPEGLEFPDGRPAKNTPVLVRQGNGDPALLYLDKERNTPGPNPVSTDAFGNVRFLAAPGEYDIVINGTAMPVLVPVHPNDPGFGIGGEGTGGYIHEQTVGISLVQVPHGLPWKPGGITAIETSGDVIEPASISHPLPGVTELEFGVLFTGKIYLS